MAAGCAVRQGVLACCGDKRLHPTLAGAREKIYHDPKHVTAAIVTCGGLCPGLNDVVAVRRRCSHPCAAG